MINERNKHFGKKLYLLANIVKTEDRLEDLLELLSSGQTDKLRVNDLNVLSFLPENHLYSIFQLMIDLQVIIPGEDHFTGFVDTSRLIWLEEHLLMFIGAMSHYSESRPESDIFEIAWTLPKEVSHLSSEVPPERSLASLIKSVISRANHELYIVSPYLDIDGLELIQIALEGINSRNVATTLISHGLATDTDFSNDLVRRYREIVPQINILTTSPIQNRYLLVHSKLIIADRTHAVLSSANLTKYGLDSHLELGIGFSGSSVKTLHSLIQNLINSSLVHKIEC